VLGHGFMRLFQGAILFRMRGMADPPSLGKRRFAWVTANTELFTAHYGEISPGRRRAGRLFKRSDAVDGLLQPVDRNNL
jgi:hypothetical protein